MADSRLDTLNWLYEITRDSIEEAPADRRSPLIAQLRGIAEEIADLGGEMREPERNGLIDFQAALADRKQSAAKGSHRTAH